MNALTRLTMVLLALSACALAAADEPLRVYTYGAPGAMVYVAPQSAIGSDAASSADIGMGAFAPKYFRGKAPLQTDLKPGVYLVSVMPQADYSMRDAMMKAHDYVWDGYDYHALVDQKNTRFRYAQCYLVEKQKDVPAEVLAVFTDQMPDGQALVFDLGKKTTRFTAGDEAAGEQLEAARVPGAFTEDVTKAVQAGQKVIIRSGADRWVIVADRPEHLRVITAKSSNAWASHRLSICSSEENIF